MWSVLLSSLRPVRRRASQLTAVLGSNNLIGSRGFTSGDTSDTTKPHLYVVLDDHEDGFGVHKLDLDDHDDVLYGGARRLPEPPVLRVALTTLGLGEHVQFATVGSSIVGIGTTIVDALPIGSYLPTDIGGVLIYDTKTAVLTVTSQLPNGLLDGGYKAAIAIGNCLYMLGCALPSLNIHKLGLHRESWSKWYGGGSLHCLTADPVDIQGDMFWGWEPLSDPSPWCWSDFHSPPMLPFFATHIMAHAVHVSPPGAPTEQHEILVSTRPTGTSMLGATFSFGTVSRKWTHRGEWHLPVIGHAHYDGHLDAWVGLHADDDGTMKTDGHLCVGNVRSAPLEWKVGKEKLFHLYKDVAAGWKHVDSKLVPITSGEGRNEYCLMERLRPEGEGERAKDCWGYRGKCLLRLTCFRVELGQEGEPMATAFRQARSYEVSWHNRHFDAQAFWM